MGLPLGGKCAACICKHIHIHYLQMQGILLHEKENKKKSRLFRRPGADLYGISIKEREMRDSMVRMRTCSSCAFVCGDEVPLECASTYA